jgi:hypothetical protein
MHFLGRRLSGSCHGFKGYSDKSRWQGVRNAEQIDQHKKSAWSQSEEKKHACTLQISYKGGVRKLRRGGVAGRLL